jgi:hypothetical protein
LIAIKLTSAVNPQNFIDFKKRFVEIMLDGIVNCCRAKLIEKFPPEAD